MKKSEIIAALNDLLEHFYSMSIQEPMETKIRHFYISEGIRRILNLKVKLEGGENVQKDTHRTIAPFASGRL